MGFALAQYMSSSLTKNSPSGADPGFAGTAIAAAFDGVELTGAGLIAGNDGRVGLDTGVGLTLEVEGGAITDEVAPTSDVLSVRDAPLEPSPDGLLQNFSETLRPRMLTAPMTFIAASSSSNRM